MRLSIISIFIMVLAGCGSDNVSEDGSPDYNALNILPVGNWVTDCVIINVDSVSTDLWSIANYRFTENTVENNWRYFTDDGCTEPYVETENLWLGFQGDYKFLKHIESANKLKANLYEISFSDPDASPATVEIGFYFEYEKMNYVMNEDGNYYVTYYPTFYFE